GLKLLPIRMGTHILRIPRGTRLCGNCRAATYVDCRTCNSAVDLSFWEGVWWVGFCPWKELTCPYCQGAIPELLNPFRLLDSWRRGKATKNELERRSDPERRLEKAKAWALFTFA